ncbi:MAG: helix-turn-helix transcriptional regulator [Candidatus Aminicenantes bacterium]|nr:MAG: helix-turn-helix transcriptional regulator [Candidatus Aminicenantes bacterium]
MQFLSRIEEILLLAIWKLGDNAYGIAIREQVEKDTGVKWLSGAIYGPLSRLRKNGYVKTAIADSVADQRGRPRIYYTLTPVGKEKLQAIQILNRGMWAGVTDVK